MSSDGFESQLRELGKIISATMGIDFADRKLPDLRRGIERAAKELGHGNWVSCLHWLLQTPMTKDTVQALAAHLTIGETYFFRDEKLFKAIEQRIFPDIIRDALKTAKVIRIWCAGCSTGEEPYSLAILLHTALRDLSTWNVTILGTDINTNALRRAKEGVYTEWSFRGAPDWLKSRYFVKQRDGRYRLIDEVRNLVTFAYHNLVEDPFPTLINNTNAMHVILCRNVLMYFNPEVRRRVVQHFQACLVDRGWLIASPAETALINHPFLKRVTLFGTIAHQKVCAAGSYTEYNVLPDPESLVQPFWMGPALEAKKGADTAPDVARSHEAQDASKSETILPTPAETRKALSFEEAQRLYQDGRYEELIKQVASIGSSGAGRQSADARVFALASRALANAGRLEEAQHWCREAINSDKTNPSLRFLLATILQELGAFDEAIKTLKTAIYLDQDFVPAHFALANLEMRRGNVNISRKHFKNVLKLLEKFEDDAPIAESEGMTVGRMREIVRSIADES
ncbi:MAG: CheR family methyltransferase [Desulfomonilaceae bacterium]